MYTSWLSFALLAATRADRGRAADGDASGSRVGGLRRLLTPHQSKNDDICIYILELRTHRPPKADRLCVGDDPAARPYVT